MPNIDINVVTLELLRRITADYNEKASTEAQRHGEGFTPLYIPTSTMLEMLIYDAAVDRGLITEKELMCDEWLSNEDNNNKLHLYARLLHDLQYYYSHGNRNQKALYHKDIDVHVKELERLGAQIPEDIRRPTEELYLFDYWLRDYHAEASAASSKPLRFSNRETAALFELIHHDDAAVTIRDNIKFMFDYKKPLSLIQDETVEEIEDTYLIRAPEGVNKELYMNDAARVHAEEIAAALITEYKNGVQCK